MNTTKLNNIEKIAQGRLSGFSANYVNDTRMSAKWLIELAQEVRRLDAHRRVYRARSSAIHRLLAKVEAEGEHGGQTDWHSGYLDGRHSLAQEIKSLLGTSDD